MTALSAVITSVLQGHHSLQPFPSAFGAGLFLPADFQPSGRAGRRRSQFNISVLALLSFVSPLAFPSPLDKIFDFCLSSCTFWMQRCSAQRDKVSEKKRSIFSALQLVKESVSCTRLREVLMVLRLSCRYLCCSGIKIWSSLCMVLLLFSYVWI